MSRSKATHTTLAAILILLAASCAGNGLSDGSSADVVLQIEQMQTSPVSATPETGTGTCSISGSGCTINADCPLVGEQCQGASGCKLTATEWNVSFRNEPKNTSAESPFNDIVMQQVEVTYTWAVAGPTVTAGIIGLGGVTIPVSETAESRFFPITSSALLDPAVEGNSADMIMNFRGRTVEGVEVNLTTRALLFVEDCP